MKSVGYIDESGKYHKGETNHNSDDVSPIFKQWSHDKQRREHAQDIVQPYKNGKPNDEFIFLYPEEAKNYGFI